MDPKILDLIIKLGSSGGLLTIIAILIYVIYTQHNEMKEVQQSRIDDKEKCQEHILEETEKSHDILDKVVTVVEKQNIQIEARFDSLDKDMSTLKEHIKDFN